MAQTVTRLAGVLAHLPEKLTPDGDVLARVDIDIAGALIAGVTPPGHTPPPDGARVIDGSRLFAVPGLINSHYHSHENFQKGRFEGLTLELWMNLVRPLTPVPVTPEQVYLRTMIGAIQALRSGTTTIVDDLNPGAGPDTALIDAAMRAYDDAGIRAYVGPTLFDRPFFRAVPFVEDSFPPDLLAELDALPPPPAQKLLDLAETMARTRHPRDHRVAFILAPSAPQRCSDAFLMRVRDLADRHDLPVIIHVHETRLQVVTGQQLYGCSMIAHLHALGFLRPATSIIHGVWVSDDDLDLIAQSGASVQHNPVSNLKLGSGLAPLRAMLARGINVSLGSDGCGSIESVDMLRVLAATPLLQTLRDGDPSDWITSTEALDAATRGGARALGREDLGVLRAGARADIALYDTHSIAMTPLNNPLRQLVFAETGMGLRHLFVDGAQVMADGHLTRVDESEIIARIHDAAAKLSPAIARAEASVGRIRAAYEVIHARCCATPIPADVLPAKLPKAP
ncbi:amidohydrolase family protein [Pseudotabrizicola algicola]|uniref:Amidohydrolase family protein n=1 Tax=Pseudotabrizicola algicola TaxID=2709381 RepID=A0A6B3RTF2_9RHOB|nr:amidohydrolase family protein [Pseudotabrizicola algicola]NEX48811.1 amidohydrolase family protein [Pseudotabrizicola algicola]